MGVFRMTAAAQKAGTILPAGYYPCKISHSEEKESKNGGSMNTFVNFQVVSGPYAGIALRTNFNSAGLDPEKGAPGAAVALQFLKSLGVEVKENEDIEIRMEALDGKNIDVYSQPGEYNGKPQNQVTGFRPFSG